jgi:hypothetical protein
MKGILSFAHRPLSMLRVFPGNDEVLLAYFHLSPDFRFERGF